MTSRKQIKTQGLVIFIGVGKFADHIFTPDYFNFNNFFNNQGIFVIMGERYLKFIIFLNRALRNGFKIYTAHGYISDNNLTLNTPPLSSC